MEKRSDPVRALRTVCDAALEFAHPTRCAGCELPGALLCTSCLGAMPLIAQASACLRCGAPDGRVRCRECEGASFAFAAARCAGTLDRPLSRAITVYKDAGERRLAGPLAELATEAAGAWMGWADVFSWVPASSRARARRGFDHAELLARALAAHADVPCAPLLVHRHARDQRGLDRQQRRANLQGVFASLESAAPGRVVLIDDVMTTGATLDAAAGALRAAGAQQVRAVALARKLAERASG